MSEGPSKTTSACVDHGAAPRGRGRPRGFDETAALEAAMTTFWEHGYEATSVSDLVASTGLNKSSLYNTFGSKDQLLVRSLDHYVELRQARLRDLVRDGSGGLDDIFVMLQMMEDESRGAAGHMGCLALNVCNELGRGTELIPGLAARYRDVIRTNVRAALDRAEALGEIAPGHAAQHTEVMVALIVASSILARSADDDRELADQYRAIRAQVEAWRINARA